MSSVSQVHAVGAEQPSTSEKEKVVGEAMFEENACVGKEQRALKRKTVSDLVEDGPDMKRRMSPSGSPVSTKKEQAGQIKRESNPEETGNAEIVGKKEMKRESNPKEAGNAEIVRKRKASEEISQAGRDTLRKKPKVSRDASIQKPKANRDASTKKSKASRDASVKKPMAKGAFAGKTSPERASVAAARREASSELASKPGKDGVLDQGSSEKPASPYEGQAQKRKAISEDGEGGQDARPKRAKIAPAEKPAPAGKARRTARKGTSVKSRKPGMSRATKADNLEAKKTTSPKDANTVDPLTSTANTKVPASEDEVSKVARSTTEDALNVEVGAVEEKASSSEVPSPGTLKTSPSTIKTTPEQPIVGELKGALPANNNSSPLGKKGQKGRGTTEKKPAKTSKIVPPRGILNPASMCFANALFQGIEQYFPDDYTQSQDGIPLAGPGVSEVLQALSNLGKREASQKKDELEKSLDLFVKEGGELSLGPWLVDFFKRLRQGGITGGTKDAVQSEHFMAVCGRVSRGAYSGLMQEDPAAFAEYLMGQLYDEWATRHDGPEPEPFPLEQVFRGSRMNSRTTCNKCNHVENGTPAPFWTFLVQVPLMDEAVKLTDLLEGLAKPKPDPSIECRGCKVQGECSTSSEPVTTPSCLLLQLYRIKESMPDYGTKITTVVDIPHEEFSICGKTYRLSGVLKHCGSGVNGGHYIAYTERDGDWFECNDRLTKKTTVERATARTKREGDPCLIVLEQVD